MYFVRIRKLRNQYSPWNRHAFQKNKENFQGVTEHEVVLSKFFNKSIRDRTTSQRLTEATNKGFPSMRS